MERWGRIHTIGSTVLGYSDYSRCRWSNMISERFISCGTMSLIQQSNTVWAFVYIPLTALSINYHRSIFSALTDVGLDAFLTLQKMKWLPFPSSEINVYFNKIHWPIKRNFRPMALRTRCSGTLHIFTVSCLSAYCTALECGLPVQTYVSLRIQQCLINLLYSVIHNTELVHDNFSHLKAWLPSYI